MDLNLLQSKFTELFGNKSSNLFFAPGRANLIGEHTDYNGGNVFPCALTFGTYLLAAKRNDDKINFYSLNFPQDGFISTDLKTYKKGADWTNYPKGMLDVMLKAGAPINSGFDAVYMGNIPNGAGLSSSASIEVLTGVMLNTFFNCGLDMLQIALLGQKAENQFVGVNCGIMDQFIIAMGKKDNAVLLDCNTLRYTHVPVVLKGVSILIANTNKRRELADSKYNERRGECDGALALLQQKFNIKALCDLTLEQLESAKDLIPNPVVYKRARHAVAENARTLKAVDLLKAGEIKAFAKLMDASHASLRDDYEVTGKELDAIVAALQKQQGVLGARMMGAGFGGCSIALVEDAFIEPVKAAVAKEYFEKTGLKADFYVAGIGDGAGLIK